MFQKRWISTCLIVIILLNLFPGQRSTAQSPVPDNNYDDAAALMIAAQNRMLGAEDANELRQLYDMRQAYFNQVQQRVQDADLDTDSTAWQITVQQHNQFQNQLDTRADQLDAARNRARNSNPLRRFTNWVGKGLKKSGRALGAITSATMTGIGKGAQYAIEDAPRYVLNDVLETGGTILLTGGTVNITMLKRLAVSNWKNRAVKAIKNHVIDEVANRVAGNNGGDELDKTLRAMANQDFDPGLNYPSTLDPDSVAGNVELDDEPDTSSIPVGPEGDMDYDDESGVIAAPMGSLDDSSSVIVGGVSSDPNATGGSNITEKRPVAFKNTGTISATVKVQTYQPPEGYTGNYPNGSTVVAPSGNSSAYLELPLGSYVFCFDWDLGKDSDGDGYTDYQHASSPQFTVISNHSKNVDNAVVVTFSAPSSSPAKGRCGESQQDQAAENISLTAQELANQGKHTYSESCNYSNGQSLTMNGTYNFNFTADGLTESGESWTKISSNVYTSGNITFTFTINGFTNIGSYTDNDGSIVTWNCTGTWN